MTKVYEVIAKTAAIDYGSRSETISMGLFLSEENAKAEIESIKSKPHWYMDYDSVEYVEKELVG
jgi:hypothetical protein